MPYQPAGNSSSGGSKTAKMSQLKFWNKQNNNKQQEKQLQQDSSGDSIIDGSNGNNSGSNGSNSSSTGGSNSKSESKSGKRNWLHTPEQLINGHAVYLVKFFGNLSVDQPKGIEVVKDAIRKLQFAQQMKKAETGTQEKFKKLEITISIKGVAIQEPRTHKILHQFPLYNISYCADEKGVKKFFSFIAKTVKSKDTTMDSNGYNGSSSNNSSSSSKPEETHECFVFISNKLASDITLTIGQAFDLAYRKFMDSNEKTNLNKAQQQIEHLQQTVAIYKERLRELSAKLPKAELDAMLYKLGIKDILETPSQELNGNETLSNGKLDDDKLLIDTNSSTASTHSASPNSFLPIVPPRSTLSSQMSSNSSGGGGGGSKSNSQKMDELLLNSDSDSDFDPRADEIQDNLSNGRNAISNDLFGFEPSKSFGQQLFFNNNDNKLQNNNNSSLSNNNNNMNNANNMSNNSSGFSSELNITPPLLAPPPKIAAPRRTISMSNSGNGLNGNTDLFGSDPFDMNNGPSVFKSQLNIDDFSLESLDPLRK